MSDPGPDDLARIEQTIEEQFDGNPYVMARAGDVARAIWRNLGIGAREQLLLSRLTEADDLRTKYDTLLQSSQNHDSTVEWYKAQLVKVAEINEATQDENYSLSERLRKAEGREAVAKDNLRLATLEHERLVDSLRIIDDGQRDEIEALEAEVVSLTGDKGAYLRRWKLEQAERRRSAQMVDSLQAALDAANALTRTKDVTHEAALRDLTARTEGHAAEIAGIRKGYGDLEALVNEHAQKARDAEDARTVAEEAADSAAQAAERWAQANEELEGQLTDLSAKVSLLELEKHELETHLANERAGRTEDGALLEGLLVTLREAAPDRVR